MEWSIQAQNEPPYLRATVQGRVELGATTQALSHLWASQAESGVHRVLWDLREAAVPGFSTRQVRKLARLQLKDRPELPPARAAFLVSSDLSYGLGRMIAAYLSRAPVTMNVFRDPDEARSWLMEVG